MNQLTFSNEITLKARAAFFVGLLFILSGCNTIEGIGEDIEESGERIEESAS